MLGLPRCLRQPQNNMWDSPVSAARQREGRLAGAIPLTMC